MADLVTSDYVRATYPKLRGPQLAVLDSVVASASSAVRRWTRRYFERRSYLEIVDLDPDRKIKLREYPIREIRRVSAGPAVALTIRYAGSGQRATFELTPAGNDDDAEATPAGLSLRSVASGVATASTILLSTTPTVAALADAISLTPGWLASVQGDFGPWNVADLAPSPGAVSALDTDDVGPILFAEELQYKIDRRSGIMTVKPSGGYAADAWRTGRAGWSGSDDTGPEDGEGTVCVAYDAGYDAIPPDVIQATLLTVKATLDANTRNFSVENEAFVGYSTTRTSDRHEAVIPAVALSLLAPYRSHR